MKRHQLKIKSRYFKQQISGLKNFELRLLDRDFNKGDEINLIEVSITDGEYLPTGNHCFVRITCVLQSYEGLKPGYGILGTQLIHAPT